MNQRDLFGLLLLMCCAFLPQSSMAQDKKPKEQSGKDVFGLNKVWDFHLELSAREWERMQMVRGGGMPFGGFGGPKKGPEEPKLKQGEEQLEYHKGSGFGTMFPWAHASFSAEGQTYKNVGLRYKGNASFGSAGGALKRNLRIDLDHYRDEQRFHGLKSVTLNAGAMDRQRNREALAYAVFRASGVPAPRTAFAQVTLTVPGKYDKEYVGVYTFVEHVDKTFLKDHFKNGKGLLLKPERVRALDYLGDDWSKYRDRYNPKHEPSKKESQRVINFARLINQADAETFNREIDSYLDIDEFLRFLAVNAMIVNLDSFFTMGHNYYVYLNPQSNKFAFIPWDLDLSFAGFPMMGAADKQTDLSLIHPYPGEHKLIDRLLAIPQVSKQYNKILKELAASSFSKEKLMKQLELIEQTTKEPLAHEAKAVDARKEGKGEKGFGPPGGMFGQGLSLKSFVEKRTESVVAQLDGKSKGYVPEGFGGPKGFGPGDGKGKFGPGNFMAKGVLTNLDTNKDGKLSKDEFIAGVKKFFADCDEDKSGKLNEKALAEGLNLYFQPPPGFGPPGKGKGPMMGFGPGNGIAGNIMKRAEAGKDGTITLDKLIKVAESFFKEYDKENKGQLDEAAIAASINSLLMPPPGFGPLGFGPPGFGPPDARPEEKKDFKKEGSK
jgi:spore coat protein H